MRSLKFGLLAAALALAATSAFAASVNLFEDNGGTTFSASTVELYWPEKQVVKFCGWREDALGCFYNHSLTPPVLDDIDYSLWATPMKEFGKTLPASVTNVKAFAKTPKLDAATLEPARLRYTVDNTGGWPMDDDVSAGAQYMPYADYT